VSTDRPTPAEEVSRLYEEAESATAKAMERLVGSEGFGVALGRMAENAAAMTRLAGDTMDLVLRNLRLAGRRDVVRLARQLARTEDKLERVLQEVEELRAELSSSAGSNSRKASSGGSQNRGSRARSKTGESAGR
jgi:hypothetical protein